LNVPNPHNSLCHPSLCGVQNAKRIKRGHWNKREFTDGLEEGRSKDIAHQNAHGQKDEDPLTKGNNRSRPEQRPRDLLATGQQRIGQ